MTSKRHRTFDVMLDGILMSVRCTFDVEPRVFGVGISVDAAVDISVDIGIAISVDGGVDISVDIGVPISVDGGVDISVDIGVPIGAVINVDICVPIGVDSWAPKHIKRFDGGLMLDRGSRVRF